MTKSAKLLSSLIIVLAAVLSACAIGTTTDIATPDASATVGLANPASTNCVEQGGQLMIETDGSGGQYGVCVFDDNRQCEEWAMMRGDCPVGGLKITGYLTDAARFCAINGGEYTITANSGQPDEQGDCTFSSGVVCTAEAFYNRTCSSGLSE